MRGSPNGETRQSKPLSPMTQSISHGREPGELKHLSSQRKRKKTSIPKVAASEMGRAQTVVRAPRGSDSVRYWKTIGELFWKSRPEGVKASYPKSKASQLNPEYHETRETLWERAGTTP